MTNSARMHYATLALVELAKSSQSNSLVSANEISDRHQIPGPFLVQILRTLRNVGWVQSVRGSHGGYRLATAADELTLLQIAEVTGQLTPRQSLQSETRLEKRLHAIWSAADEAARHVLRENTLEDLVQYCENEDQMMFYI
ncbi:MAG: Rrf2 family transcriptional regulator [Planctomycetota bacterium]